MLCAVSSLMNLFCLPALRCDLHRTHKAIRTTQIALIGYVHHNRLQRERLLRSFEARLYKAVAESDRVPVKFIQSLFDTRALVSANHELVDNLIFCQFTVL